MSRLSEPALVHGNSRQTYRGARQINESTLSSATRNPNRRSSGGTKSFNTDQSSNQIVLCEKRNGSRQFKNLSMAIALAFENSIKLTKSGSSNSSNTFANFFNRFDQGSIDITYQFPTASNFQIAEISKGVQKLNQILRACSNGVDLDRNSIEIGKELLRGAINLEDSLRMLANLHEPEEYTKGSGRKSRITLLGEDDEEQESTDKISDRQLARPRFSFDKPNRNSNGVQNGNRNNFKRQEMALLYLDGTSKQQPILNSKSNSNSSQGKGRISNVVAKLMGLEDLPQKEVQRDISSKGKVSSNNPKFPEPSIKKSNRIDNTQPIRDTKFDARGEKSRETLDGSSKTVKYERNESNRIGGTPPMRHAKFDSKGEKSRETLVEKSQQNHTRLPNLATELRIFRDTERKQISKPRDRTEQKVHPFQKQNSIDKTNKTEPVISSQTKKKAPNLQKKQLGHKTTHENVKPTNPIKKFPLKDPPIDNSRHAAAQKEDYSSPREIQSDKEDASDSTKLSLIEKPIKKSDAEKANYKANSRQVEKTEKPLNMIKRRNGSVNHLTRSLKESDKRLQDLKQKMYNKNIEKPRDKLEKEELGIIVYDPSGARNEPLEQPDKLGTKEEEAKIASVLIGEECQTRNISNMLNRNDSCGDIYSKSEEVYDHLQKQEEPSALREEEERTDREKSTSIAKVHKESIPLHKKFQHEQLTEPEKHLKEIVIKDPFFLNTAEALFKLNIPVNFLHDQSDQVAAKNKLILDCGYELMKRKVRINESKSYTKFISSLDDLIKQLCRNFESLKFDNRNGSDESDVADFLYKMLEKDIFDNDPEVNSTWDFEWNRMMHIVTEKEEVVREVEKHVMNGLIDEIMDDMFSLVNIMV